jgi:hypothetical protein
MPVILATWEAEMGGLQFKVSLGRELVRPHFNREKLGDRKPEIGGSLSRLAWAKSEILSSK